MTQKISPRGILSAFITLAILSLFTGCNGRAELWPNSDKSLRKTSAQFAADAAKRFPYKSTAPAGGEAKARAQVGYTLNRVQVINLSDEPWTNVEVWINKSYVVFIPTMEPRTLKNLPFQAIFNDAGESFPTNNTKILVNEVDLYRDGKLYTVPKQLAD